MHFIAEMLRDCSKDVPEQVSQSIQEVDLGCSADEDNLIIGHRNYNLYGTLRTYSEGMLKLGSW